MRADVHRVELCHLHVRLILLFLVILVSKSGITDLLQFSFAFTHCRGVSAVCQGGAQFFGSTREGVGLRLLVLSKQMQWVDI